MSATSPVVLHAGQMNPKKLAVIYTFSRVAANAFLTGGRKKRPGTAGWIGDLQTGQKAII
jgi:hypothetical protein